MILLNFSSHEVTPTQFSKIEALKGLQLSQVIEHPIHLDANQAVENQIQKRLEEIWPSLVNGFRTLAILPGLAPAAAIVLAEMHGFLGHFPEIVRIRPNPNAPDPYEVAEIIDLQSIRTTSRQRKVERNAA